MLSHEVSEPGWNTRAPTIGQVKQLAKQLDSSESDSQIEKAIQVVFPDQLTGKVIARRREAIRKEHTKNKPQRVMSLDAEARLNDVINLVADLDRQIKIEETMGNIDTALLEVKNSIEKLPPVHMGDSAT